VLSGREARRVESGPFVCHALEQIVLYSDRVLVTNTAVISNVVADFIRLGLSKLR
jgi:hypothetical protein